MFYYYLLFRPTNEINSFIETNYGDLNFIRITNKVAYRACRARGDGRVALAVQHARNSTYDFSYTEMQGLDSESWRVVT